MSNDDRHEEDRAEWASRQHPIVFDETSYFAAHHEPRSDHDTPYRAMDLPDGRRIEAYHDRHVWYQDGKQIASYPVVPTVRFHSARAAGKTAELEAWEELQRAWQDLVKTFATELAKVQEVFARVDLRTWDIYGNPPGPPEPTNPKARALWLAQHRNTGPAQPSAQNARRPRRHR